MPSLSQRLQRLEKGTPDPVARCPKCGGPDPNGRRIATVSDTHPLGYCDECDCPIDSDGNPLGEWRNGELHLKVIRF